MSQGQRAVVVQPGEGLVIPIGQSSVRLLSVGGDTADLSSAEEIIVPPGFDGPPPHFHERTNHSWYVIEGELRLTVEEVSYDLTPGGFVYVPVGSSHTFANQTSSPAAMVEFTTPGGFDRYLSDLADAFPSGTEIDPDRMIEIMARHDTYPATSNRT
jgi:mannose-6-phosphate isomerase-like protein (cupin superfamily)